ncbi:MAG TPA: hypothetical protein GXZ90_00600 [Clostridiales bacterium]|nr:hypothetical protein [Clostridiales bacterium]
MYHFHNPNKLKITSKIVGKTVYEINIRSKFNLNMIAIVKEDVTSIDIKPDLILGEGDLIVIIGKTNDVQRFENFMYNVK